MKQVLSSTLKSDARLFKRLFKEYIHPHRFMFAFAIFLMLAIAGLTASYTFIIQSMLDKIFVDKNVKMLAVIPLAIIGVAFLKNACTYFQITIMQVILAKISAKMRLDFCRYYLRADISAIHSTSSGEVVSNLSNQINGISGGINLILVNLVRELLTIAFLVGALFIKNPALAAIGLVAMPFAMVPVVKISRKLRKVLLSQQGEVQAFSSLVDDVLKSPKIVKSYNAEGFEEGRIQKTLNHSLSLAKKIIRLSNISSPLVEGVSTIGFALVIWYGGYQVINGITSPGVFFAFIGSMALAYKPAKSLSGLNSAVQGFFMSLKIYYDILDQKPEVKNSPDAKILQSFDEAIELKNISFSYKKDGLKSIDQMSLKITKGQKVAFVGKTGAGKSTIINLLLRFYDVNEGSIAIDGTDIKQLDISSLRDKFSYVGQDVSLFNDTIAANIRYNKTDASMDEVKLAACLAHADEFIDKLPDGYNYKAGQYGSALSGGQKQRIIIARAILHNKPILILDEATSALDSVSEKYIKDALEHLMKDKTVIMIAHRLSTIKNADIIFVVEGGKIVESGTHQQLIAQNLSYAKFYNTQFKQD